MQESRTYFHMCRGEHSRDDVSVVCRGEHIRELREQRRALALDAVLEVGTRLLG